MFGEALSESRVETQTEEGKEILVEKETVRRDMRDMRDRERESKAVLLKETSWQEY